MFKLFLALMLCFSASAIAWAEEASLPPATEKVNPHDGKGNCAICHDAPEEDLNSWFTFPWNKRRLKGGPNALCQGCHGVEFGHGVGMRPEQNTKGLPMNGNGEITCAVTCHDMHLKGTENRMQKHFHLRLPQDELCLSCHDK